MLLPLLVHVRKVFEFFFDVGSRAGSIDRVDRRNDALPEIVTVVTPGKLQHLLAVIDGEVPDVDGSFFVDVDFVERNFVFGGELPDQIPTDHQQRRHSNQEHHHRDLRNRVTNQVTQRGFVRDGLGVNQILQPEIETEPKAHWYDQRW